VIVCFLKHFSYPKFSKNKNVIQRIPSDTIWKNIKVCIKDVCRIFRVPDFKKMRNKWRDK